MNDSAAVVLVILAVLVIGAFTLQFDYKHRFAEDELPKNFYNFPLSHLNASA